MGDRVELTISEIGVHPLTTAELVGDDEALQHVLSVRQSYPQTNESEELRSRIAALRTQPGSISLGGAT